MKNVLKFFGFVRIARPKAQQAVYLPKRQEIVVKQAALVLSLVRCGVIIK